MYYVCMYVYVHEGYDMFVCMYVCTVCMFVRMLEHIKYDLSQQCD